MQFISVFYDAVRIADPDKWPKVAHLVINKWPGDPSSGVVL
jgi:hypothetical protein